MNPHCNTTREQLAAEFGAERPWSEALESHLRECGDCSAALRRMRACTDLVASMSPVGAPQDLDALVGDTFAASYAELRTQRRLQRLERLEAPAELEGRVVAARQAGFAEERAAEHLKDLDGLEAPAALDARMGMLFSDLRSEGLFGKREAPEQLEERVEADLTDLPQAIARQTLGKLPRKDAPAVLEQRVQRDLVSEPNARGLRLLRTPGLALVASAAAAGLLWIAALQINSDVAPNGSTPGQEPALALSFEVLHPMDLSELSPRASNLAASVTGGLDAGLIEMARVPVQPLESQNAAPAAPRQPNGPAGGASAANSGKVGGGPGGSSATMGGSSSGTTNSGTSQNSGSGAFLQGPAYFAGVMNAPFEVAFRGEREVTLRTRVFDIVTEVSYEEEVASDGNGAFTIVPLNIVTPVLTWGQQGEFILRQESREGFFYRYRDFRVRDSVSFWMNYELLDLQLQQSIAGRVCETLRIQRKDGTGNIFDVVIDPATSLVMKEVCTRQNGELVSSMVFQSFQLDADLSDLQLNDGQSKWISVELPGLESAMYHELLLPSAPPSGYELQDMAYRQAPGISGFRWAQLTYGDGVEQAFFLFEDSELGEGSKGPTNGSSNPNPDLIRSYAFGAWSMIEGHVRGRYVLSVGRVSEAQLLLMLQSAIE